MELVSVVHFGSSPKNPTNESLGTLVGEKGIRLIAPTISGLARFSSTMLSGRRWGVKLARGVVVLGGLLCPLAGVGICTGVAGRGSRVFEVWSEP